MARGWSERQSFGVGSRGSFSMAIGRNWRLEIRARNTLGSKRSDNSLLRSISYGIQDLQDDILLVMFSTLRG